MELEQKIVFHHIAGAFQLNNEIQEEWTQAGSQFLKDTVPQSNFQIWCRTCKTGLNENQILLTHPWKNYNKIRPDWTWLGKEVVLKGKGVVAISICYIVTNLACFGLNGLSRENSNPIESTPIV